MDYIKLTRKIDKNLKVIGKGSEGVVYYYNGTAYKIFINSNLEDKSNKFGKLKLLHDVNINGIIVPDKIIIDSKINDIGYTMEYVESIDSLYNLTLSKSVSLKEKIDYLKKTELILKQLHKNNIVVGDMNLFNFLIDKDYSIKAIDTDNYKIGNYKNDILPSIGYPYYEENVKNKIDKNLDKFLFALYTLRNLTNTKDNYSQAVLTGETKDKQYLEKFVNSLIIDKDYKNVLMKLFNGEGNSIYIASELENMLSSNYIENKAFIETNKIK